MTRRLLPIPLLVLALLAPAAARATTYTFGNANPAAHRTSPHVALRKAQSALTGAGVKRGGDVTPLLRQLALRLPELKGAERRRALRLLARPSQGQGTADELEYDVPEHQPELCSAHFCIHWVDSGDDAPPAGDANSNGIRDYVETMSAVFEQVYQAENVGLGWASAKSDGTRGCLAGAPADCPGKTDVYIKEIGDQGIYGYASPDPNQTSFSQYAYLVMDNDYNAAQFPQYGGDPLQPMEVTAAHEYNHVLQFKYDTAQDTWMLESTATWMEDRVYTAVNDYVQYLTPWVQMTFVPLTYFSYDGDDPLNVKVYGDSVWNRWIDEHYGPDTIRKAWEVSRSTTPHRSFAPGAYDEALKAKGANFYKVFTSFAVGTAEWRAANSQFDEGETFPDVQRAASTSTGRPITLTPDRVNVTGDLSHTTYELFDVVPPNGMQRMRLAVNTPRGVRMAIALVGRTGDEVNGTSEQFVKRLPNGGPGTLTLANPSRFDRLTAVAINADSSAIGYSDFVSDWLWRKEFQHVNVRVSADFSRPTVRERTFSRKRVVIRFSNRMFELTSKTVTLIGPNGGAVKARLELTTGGKRSRVGAGAKKLAIVPLTTLRARTRYRVRLSSDLRDFGGNALRAPARSWSFRTGA
jgi:Big-like domain-containing protein